VLAAGLDAKDASSATRWATRRRRSRLARRIEAVYAYPHQNHATMEPMNATARWTPERCEVWTPTQTARPRSLPRPSPPGCRRSQCDVYKLPLAAASGAAARARLGAPGVAIAKQMPGTPVKLLWCAEEDMLHGPLPPGDAVQAGRGASTTRARSRASRCASPASRSRGRGAAEREGRRDPVVFQGLNPSGPEAAIGYTFRAHDRPRDAQPARPAGFWRGVN